MATLATELRLLKNLVGTDNPDGKEDMREIIDRVQRDTAAMLAALEHVEAVLSIVEPRSDKAEYLATLAEVRAAIAEAKGE
jgi:Mg2+ and Co2+ transporter CorA